MSATPRTEAFCAPERGLGTGYYQALDFARGLERELIAAQAENATLKERIAGGWKPLDSAPRDGTTIEGLYAEGPALIRWSERPVCMLGSRNGGYPPGWATTGGQTDENLPMDAPMAWREKDYQDEQLLAATTVGKEEAS